MWADAGCSASWWEVGPPVSGSPRLPFLCCGESDRWSPKVPFWSQRRFFRPACFFPPQPEGNLPGEHASHARPQPSTAARVNCLQRGVALPPRSPTNTLLPPSGCEHPLHICFEVLCELRHFFLQTKHALSRSLSDACFEITKTPGVM